MKRLFFLLILLFTARGLAADNPTTENQFVGGVERVQEVSFTSGTLKSMEIGVEKVGGEFVSCGQDEFSWELFDGDAIQFNLNVPDNARNIRFVLTMVRPKQDAGAGKIRWRRDKSQRPELLPKAEQGEARYEKTFDSGAAVKSPRVYATDGNVALRSVRITYTLPLPCWKYGDATIVMTSPEPGCRVAPGDEIEFRWFGVRVGEPPCWVQIQCKQNGDWKYVPGAEAFDLGDDAWKTPENGSFLWKSSTLSESGELRILYGTGDNPRKIREKSWEPNDKRPAGTRNTQTVNGVEFAFRWCPAGSFEMGSPKSEAGRYDFEKRHQVTISRGFWLMETEVTQAQWKAVMGNNPGNFKGDNLPVENVSWNDCQEFCRKAKSLDLPLALPSEARWEYACRAGTKGAYAGNLDEMAWYVSNSGGERHPVATKKANTWGIYDMHGNVWEWCQDMFKKEFSSSTTEDAVANGDGSNRVDRGGNVKSTPANCRSAARFGLTSDYSGYNRGFRCVREQLEFPRTPLGERRVQTPY